MRVLFFFSTTTWKIKSIQHFHTKKKKKEKEKAPKRNKLVIHAWDFIS